MRVSEQICEEAKNLPEPLQEEVLNYVQYLAANLGRESAPGGQVLRNLSLSLAMRGMEDETGPHYSLVDLREKF